MPFLKAGNLPSPSHLLDLVPHFPLATCASRPFSLQCLHGCGNVSVLAVSHVVMQQRKLYMELCFFSCEVRAEEAWKIMIPLMPFPFSLPACSFMNDLLCGLSRLLMLVYGLKLASCCLGGVFPLIITWKYAEACEVSSTESSLLTSVSLRNYQKVDFIKSCFFYAYDREKLQPVMSLLERLH